MGKLYGGDFLESLYDNLTTDIKHETPSEYNERSRILPSSVSNIPGPMSFSIVPYMREIVDCLDINSTVRDVSFMKGVQVGYTTAVLEGGIFYYMGKVGSAPVMYITSTGVKLTERFVNNIIPMFHQSGLWELIKTSDEGNRRKSGIAGHTIQWAGGGYLVGVTSGSASSLKSSSVRILLKDELDTWPTLIEDGDPDAVSDDRVAAFGDSAKIFRGSTPTLENGSRIYKSYLRGDQRKYFVLCLKCSFPQYLRWYNVGDTGVVGGFHWDYDDEKQLIRDSVRYVCIDCGHEHYEHDKTDLFSTEKGAHWKATQSAPEGVRSYLLPALYSPVGMRSWASCVESWLKGWDPFNKRVKDVKALQVFYNNILGEPFKSKGDPLQLRKVSKHRRNYSAGIVPNSYAEQYAVSKILFLTCQVDIHDLNIAVSIMGWTHGARCFVIDYFRLKADGKVKCTDPQSWVWDRLKEIIDGSYDDGQGNSYNILKCFIDAGYVGEGVESAAKEFCKRDYYKTRAIFGRMPNNGAPKNFRETKTADTIFEYLINVDVYKHRAFNALSYDWDPAGGPQPQYHFNCPATIDDKQLKELVAEYPVESVDTGGRSVIKWKRVGNNELLDLFVYGLAGVEILAYEYCYGYLKTNKIDWEHFWGAFKNV